MASMDADDETFVENGEDVSHSPSYSPEKENPTTLFLRVTDDFHAMLQRVFRTVQRCEALLQEMYKEQKSRDEKEREQERSQREEQERCETRKRRHDPVQEKFISEAISQFLSSWHNHYVCFDF